MGDYYGSVAKVKTMTGVEPEDLRITADGGKSAEQVLNELLQYWMEVAKNYIDVFTDTTFDSETPAGIKNIAERIVANMVGFAHQRQTSPIVKSSDHNVYLVKDDIITEAIKDDLEMYLSEHAATTKFSISISNRLTREADEDAGVD